MSSPPADEPSDGNLLEVQHSRPDGQVLDDHGNADDMTELNFVAGVRNQDDLERDIGRQAETALNEDANKRDLHRLERTRTSRDKLAIQIQKLREQTSRPIGTTQRAKLHNDIDRFRGQLEELEDDLVQIQGRIDERVQATDAPSTLEAQSTGKLASETQREFLIRTGKITPFSKYGLGSLTRTASNLQDALLDAEEEPEEETFEEPESGRRVESHRHLKLPGFGHYDADEKNSAPDFRVDRSRKRRKIERSKEGCEDESLRVANGKPPAPVSSPALVSPELGSDESYLSQDGEEGEGSDEFVYDNDSMPDRAPPTALTQTKRTATYDSDEEVEDLRGLDDGKESLYQARLQRWIRRRQAARQRANRSLEDSQNDDDESDMRELHLPHPENVDADFGDGFRIPGDIYPYLFDYQKTGVQWLWELYSQQVGGIIGDEMGLGKTIQVIAFLAGLYYSGKLTKPIIVVCPATVMKQWVNEFHRWWPPFRVTILHTSGSGMINVKSESSREDALLSQMWNPDVQKKALTAGQKAAKKILQPILDNGGVLVTTYSGLQTYAPLLIPLDWEYAVLDEGHKIRNPNAAITIYCKELRTANRIILSGTPMQNNLVELWSLFDFVFPMRLGTLVNFRNQFDIPIRQGGYANASNLQVQTAFKCAETLKDAISPYLLQRYKIDVAADLPKKSEQVLFCRLTKLQRKEYESFLGSDDMKSILSGRRQVLYGIDILRKICNHPDLQNHKHLSGKADYGNGIKSGKMQVVKSLLELWRDTGHKTLLFAQHRIMLDILEKFVKSLTGFKFRRMDGNTPIQARQNLVDEFNNSPDIHLFLLTTKVGGLGVNLTGADRVIIYDPDWNPSTDLQARERAWRLGQKREVTIYRLMTAGTIEEKIYHRQIFKQFLTNKILRDPKQRQTFNMSDLHDLFTLGDEQAPTETSTLFRDVEVTYKPDANGLTSNRSAGEDATALGADGTRSGDVGIHGFAGISSVERYAGEAAEVEKKAEGTNSEARMMEGIFAKSGIHSAVEHDQIINGKKIVTADPRMIEQEAKKVAAEAAKELRQAGEVARTVPIGTPTWTGQFGVAGRPEETTPQRAFAGGRGRGGPSSSSLLAGLQSRQTMPSNMPASGTASPSGRSSRAGTPNARGKDFGKLIRDFLVVHGGSVPSQMLVDHFNRMCTSPQSTTEFKETLKAIATLEKGSRGRGRWVLKQEYKIAG